MYNNYFHPVHAFCGTFVALASCTYGLVNIPAENRRLNRISVKGALNRLQTVSY